MGLDMYLEKRIYIGANYNFNKVEGTIDITACGKKVNINLNKVSYIVEAAAYWRKANQIHNWFVENVQNGTDDCKSYYVSEEQLQQLIDTCKEVLADHDKAPDLLPTCSGFFFGDTDYDEYYYEDLEDTVKQLEEVLSNASDRAEFYYNSSW